MTSPTIARMSAAEYRAQKKPKRSKYRAVKTVVDGITFDSRAEANYYQLLKEWERRGEISDVQLQVPFPLTAGKGMLIGTYRADFVFMDSASGERRVVDVKGFDTPLSKWKRKHVRAQYGVKVEIVK